MNYRDIINPLVLNGMREWMLKGLTTEQKFMLQMRVIAVIVVFHLAYVSGLLKAFGWAGHADAGEVSAVKLTILDQQIWDVRVAQCNADSTDARRSYSKRLMDLIQEWKEVKDEDDYNNLPNCDEV